MPFQPPKLSGSTNMMAAISTSGANCMLLNPSIGLGYGNGQVPASISLALSNISTVESSAAEYQDCGLSPLFLTGDSSWDSNFEPSCPLARDKAKMRYHEKKKTRRYVIIYPLFVTSLILVFKFFCFKSSASFWWLCFWDICLNVWLITISRLGNTISKMELIIIH